MYLKCLFLLFIFDEIRAREFAPARLTNRPCEYPRGFEHGRYRMRQKSKLIKFICYPGFQLVGNKYATCRDGEWDVPIPSCVKPGCRLPTVENAFPAISHGGAWVRFFCYPGLKLVGSAVMVCDGRKWNSTVTPQCVNTKAPPSLSCDFEDANLCGWTQDELHDFDWKRLNKKTPSAFLFTGPSYDHTLGEQGNGYYMYIESTSRLENDTARLISPSYEAKLAKDGCFSFYYHMFGKTTGGLRVYQKPETLPIQDLLQLQGDERMKYLIFEKWGNQGDVWYYAVDSLKDLAEDFQIVIEGIRGTSFTSDIAIDDVAILQGENCTAAFRAATTPALVMPDSCQGRCDVFGIQPDELGCGCTAACVAESNCCPDFFDLCLFDSSTTTEQQQSQEENAELPQTQKLVARTTIKSSTLQSTSPTTIPTTSTTTSTTTITQKPTTTQKTMTTNPTTKKIATTTKKIPLIILKTTPKVVNKTGKIVKDTTKVIVSTTPKVIRTTTRSTTIKQLKTTTVQYKRSYMQDTMKAEKEKEIETRKIVFVKKAETQKSSGLKTATLTITGLLCFACAAWLFVWSRSTKGKTTIARLRGRVRNDPDVQYLHTADDD